MRPTHTFLTFCAVMALCASAAVAQSLVGTPSWLTSQVSVATSATLVAPSRPTRMNVTISQGVTGNAQVYCGPTNAVTAGNGFPINPTATAYGSIRVDTRGEVWCIAASTQTVNVMESY